MSPARPIIARAISEKRKEIEEEISKWQRGLKHPGLEYSGSSIAVFWGPELDRFAEAVSDVAYSSARLVAEDNRLDHELAARTAESEISNEVQSIISRMASVDQGMRSRGLPARAPKKNTEDEWRRCKRRLDSRGASEVELARSRSRFSVTLPLAADHGLIWFFSHSGIANRLKFATIATTLLTSGYAAGRSDVIKKLVELF